LQKRPDIDLLSDTLGILIREDKQIEKRVLQNLTSEYSSTRSGIHVTDLVLCLRQAVFRKLIPVPPGVKQLSYYLDGARRHEALQKLYSANDPAHVVSEKKGIFEGVSYSIDLYFQMPIEFKTTRAREAMPEHWIRQLAYYMLATDSNVGILQIQRIVPKDEDSIFPSYLVEFTNEGQRISWLEEFRIRKDIFRKALDAGMPQLAPIYRGENSWLCRQCPYKSRCDEIERTK